jgi:hypothetical protein
MGGSERWTDDHRVGENYRNCNVMSRVVGGRLDTFHDAPPRTSGGVRLERGAIAVGYLRLIVTGCRRLYEVDGRELQARDQSGGADARRRRDRAASFGR